MPSGWQHQGRGDNIHDVLYGSALPQRNGDNKEIGVGRLTRLVNVNDQGLKVVSVVWALLLQRYRISLLSLFFIGYN